ncbi:hypothetical protein FQA39_LY15765 [Lamprigera yunnana]|nr:hypothetical protein FQA39_LY15765 [Lamprigera yunnana]
MGPRKKPKSKHNAVQKTKEVPKQTTPQLQPVQHQLPPAPLATEKEAQIVQQTPIIPPPQQAKTTSKTNKIRDLNLKGASKEGTDMDAFNDNASLEDTNANDSNSVNNDYINNTNNVMLNNNSNTNASIVNDIKQSETNNIMTIKATSEPKCASKSKVDVTNVFQEMPMLEKNLMPLRSLEAEDEPDRVTLDNNKLVQVKNEVNKVPHEQLDCNVSDIKLNLPYKEDQWSPFNQDGKKVYDKEFLLALKGNPKSNLKPDNLPTDIVANEDRGRVGEINRYPMGGRATDFAPTFSNNTYPGKSSSQRGGIPLKRKSQQGSLSGNNKGKQGMIRLSISVREDVKLHESENAWKPARCVASATMTEDEKKTEELYKKVRGVLNKLTPQKFNTLLDQIRNFNIDTTERLQGVIDLVFEKAVDEPNFSVAYAALCGQLALMQVPAPGSNNKDGQQDFVNFRKLLITRCQLEFEKNSIDETERNSKLKEVEECIDPEKKKDLTLDLEDYDRRLRMKSVGNIRFIGELFKQNMLTVNIMMRCLRNLLTTKDEESLECLCKLLTTVGKELESKHENLTDLFNTMKDLANKKHSKISSRVRFMIQDVIDLRLSKWVPRRQEFNPKTMDQIQKEAETEQLNIQAMNSVPLSRRDDRGSVGGGNINANNEKKRRNAGGGGESDWSVATSRGNRIQQQFNIKSDKLKIALITPDEPLGNSQMFGNWGRGSNFKLPNQVGNATNSNMYAPLDGLESDKGSNIGLRSREFVLKGPTSVERYNRQPYEEALDGRGSRSGSQHRSRDSSKTSQCNIPTTVLPNTQKSQTNTVTTPLTLSSEKLEVKIRNIVEDYVNEFSDSVQSDEEVKIQIPSAAHSQLVSDGYMLVLERSQTARFKAGTLFAHLIKVDTLSLSNYCIGLETVLAECEELIIDIPMVWLYVAELIVPVLWNKVATFQDLHKPLEVVIQNKRGCKVLSSIFTLFIHKKSPAFLQSCWISSGLRFSDFMQESEVESFLNDVRYFNCISPNHGSTSYGLKKLKYEEIHNKLLSFFQSCTPFDEVTDWINANVGDAVTENQFFRVLTTAIFNYAIVNTKLKNDILQEKFNYFHYFVDNKPNYELQCLFALQSLLHKLEYPQGLLLQIFNKLYEENIFSHESFLSWEMSNDPAEQEGKGVAIKQLTSFFTQLKEADEDSSSSSVEEEMT